MFRVWRNRRGDLMSSIDNAIADIKRQLRSESKSDLIRQWVALYAQVTQLLVENDKLKKELEALQPKTESNDAPEGSKND